MSNLHIDSTVIKERIDKLKHLRNEYEDASVELSTIIDNLSDSYQVDDEGMIEHDMNIADYINNLNTKIDNLIHVLEQYLRELEDES